MTGRPGCGWWISTCEAGTEGLGAEGLRRGLTDGFSHGENFMETEAMSELNPYEKFLDGRALDTILAATPGEVGRLIQAIGAEKVSLPPAPGKWSPAEIVAHLADCELVFGFRLRQTLAEDAPVIQPFDQDKWAATYPGVQANEALSVFTAIRGW